jgi:hypothetical protein
MTQEDGACIPFDAIILRHHHAAAFLGFKDKHRRKRRKDERSKVRRRSIRLAVIGTRTCSARNNLRQWPFSVRVSSSSCQCPCQFFKLSVSARVCAADVDSSRTSLVTWTSLPIYLFRRSEFNYGYQSRILSRTPFGY